MQLAKGERRTGLVIAMAPAVALKVVRKARTGPASLRVSLDGAVVAFEYIVQGTSVELQVPPGELSVELRSQPAQVVFETE